MQKFRCHKEVQAVKIEGFETDTENCEWLYGVNTTKFELCTGFIEKHKPEIGGYYVRYGDGYESYSPGPVFESGYSLIEDEANETP